MIYGVHWKYLFRIFNDKIPNMINFHNLYRRRCYNKHIKHPYISYFPLRWANNVKIQDTSLEIPVRNAFLKY
jgi:hypothetical protein